MSTKEQAESPAAEHAALSLEFSINRALLPAVLAERCVELQPDEPSEMFIEQALAAPHGRVKTWLHEFGCHFFGDFDVNGILNMYRVHLLSTDLWRQFLPNEATSGTHLDVGAGNGNLTDALRPLFDTTRVTEASWAMRRRLNAQGYPTFGPDISAVPGHGGFQFVSCLNVLDRTPYPLTLVRDLARATAPGGWLVIAVPLPLNPFFYRGPFTLDPKQPLSARGPGWEQAVVQLLQGVRPSLPGWQLQRMTRFPYLSWGDASCSLYALDDVVLLFRHSGESASV